MTAAQTEIVRADEPPAATPWTLTELDRVNARLVLRGTWVFDAPLDADRLQAALGRLLTRYPHLAGRMVKGRAVALTNAGVPFTRAEAPDATVRELLAAPAGANRFADKPSPARVMSGRAPAFTVRLTRLRDGAVLSVCCSHAFLDGQAFYTLVRNWGRLCTGRPFPEPVLDPSLLPPLPDRSKAQVVAQARAEGWLGISLPTIARLVALLLLGRFSERTAPVHFSPEALGRLRDAARRESGCPELTTHGALAAHLTRMCVRLYGLPAGTPCSQVTVLDGRERLASIPAAYAGNAAFAARSAEFPAEASLGEVARRGHAGLAPFLARPSAKLAADVELGRQIIRHGALLVPYDLRAMHARRPTLTYVNNFSRHPIYDVDFGEPDRPLAPVRVIPHDLPDPVLIWPAPPAQGGLEVYFTGVPARAAHRLGADHPWWAELRAAGVG